MKTLCSEFSHLSISLIIFLGIGIVLEWFLYKHFQNLDIKLCPCGDHPYFKYMKVAPLIAISISIMQFFSCHSNTIKSLMLTLSLFTGAFTYWYLYVAFKYLRATKKCDCANSKSTEFYYYLLWIRLVVLALSLLGLLAIGIALIGKETKYVSYTSKRVHKFR